MISATILRIIESEVREISAGVTALKQDFIQVFGDQGRSCILHNECGLAFSNNACKQMKKYRVIIKKLSFGIFGIIKTTYANFEHVC